VNSRQGSASPNIVLILADNLGWGELGCYGGGVLRGTPTPRIDRLASEGLRLLNFNVESDCVPTRSALMTGRHPIRTGGVQAGVPLGIVPWEVTLAQLLSSRDYATAIFGKWHLGDRPGRYPNNRGFDEWYGIPRTSTESMFPSSQGYDERFAPFPYVMEGRADGAAKQVATYDLEMRRRIDSDLVVRANDFIRRQVEARRPFFAYVPLTQLHLPTIPHRDFAGRTGHGDFADSLAEMDYRIGEILDHLDAVNIAKDTLLIFASDNGPEFRRPWRGTAGPWVGTYQTAMEGGLRAPCIARWPGKVPAGRISDEIVHVTDLYVTLAKAAGATIPNDRPIDGVDQLDFLLGKQERSNREGFVFCIMDEIRAAKWRNWKLHVVWEAEPNTGPKRLQSPVLFNLIWDPKEETDVDIHNAWVRIHMQRMIREFRESLKAHPPIPFDATDDFVPKGHVR
jgi:arylsulfatase A-like enzyme